jgi:hypothetical protein
VLSAEEVGAEWLWKTLIIRDDKLPSRNPTAERGIPMLTANKIAVPIALGRETTPTSAPPE